MSEQSHPTSKKLLPCPFCGGEPWIERAGNRRYSTTIACTQCGGRHESSDQDERVGDSWNRRLGIEPAADKTCSQCYGSGTIEVADEAGPNAHPMDINCPACRGTGSTSPPFAALVAEGQAQGDYERDGSDQLLRTILHVMKADQDSPWIKTDWRSLIEITEKRLGITKGATT